MAKLSPDDAELLAFVRDNREALEGICAHWRAYQTTALLEPVIAPDKLIVGVDPAGPGWDRSVIAPDSDPLLSELRETTDELVSIEPISPIADPGILEVLNDGINPEWDGTVPDPNAPRCSVCLSVLADLDTPCETCAQAGRVLDSPESLYAAQAAAATPSAVAETVYDAPRISNAINRAPLSPPAAPPRTYLPSEVCRSCGRLPELHAKMGGPLDHSFEPLNA